MNAENTRMFISEQNKVANFDPLKFLRNGKLELKYKKLWFRLKYPAGRIRPYPLKITDQLAIIEARVYLNKEDAEPKTSFIATKDTKNSPGGLYIEAAQYAAIDQALADAGFDVQLVQTTQSVDTTSKTETVEQQVETAVEPVTKTAVEIIPEETLAESVAESVIEEAVPEQPVANDTPTPVTADGELTTADEEAAEELREVFEQTDETAFAEAYTKDMPVETICSMMTYEEAGNVIVPVGTCKGWTLSQVADRRAASLKWYINGYTGDDNILRAAATIMQENLMQQAS